MIPAGAGAEACPGEQDLFGQDQGGDQDQGQAADPGGRGPGREGSQGQEVGRGGGQDPEADQSLKGQGRKVEWQHLQEVQVLGVVL